LWFNQKCFAAKRGIAFHFTYEKWLAWCFVLLCLLPVTLSFHHLTNSAWSSILVSTTSPMAAFQAVPMSVLRNFSLYAFDLIELNGDDLRRDPLQVRKATLASVLAKARPGIRFNEHIEGDGPTVFAHACKMGLEGIVSKRKDSAYRSGRSPDWLKMKNPDAPAVTRETEEDWSKECQR
jgi:ATP dependent DNA ligase domain